MKKIALAVLACGMLNFNVFADANNNNDNEESTQENSSFGASIRENDFYLIMHQGVKDIKVDFINAIVTKGQPWDPEFFINQIEVVDGVKKLHIQFRAGRKDNDEVANIFNNIAGGEKHVLPTDSMDRTPAKLNFFIKTKLSINGSPISGDHESSQEFLIGQGNSWIHNNNWWIGGAFVSRNHNIAQVKTEDGFCYNFSQYPSSSNKFEVTMSRCD